MQQSTTTRPNQAIFPRTSSHRGKINQWPFRVASQSEPLGDDVMTNAKRIIATTRHYFFTTDACLRDALGRVKY